MSLPSVAAVKPRYRNVPPAAESDAQRATDLAAVAGLDLLAWQTDALDAMLRFGADGKWAARMAALICPRQNGKGGVLEALELFLLFLADDVELVVHTAHRFDTAQDHFRRIRGLIESTPELMARTKSIRVANGSESIETRDGRRLLFKARSKGGIRGMSPDVVVLDEAFYLWDDAVQAILPSQAARENPLTVFASSSPVPGPESDFLRRLCTSGRDGDPTRLSYVEFSAPPGSDLDDERLWAEVNPSLGTLLEVQQLRANRAVMTDDAFGAEHLGIWTEDVQVASVNDMRAWNESRRDPSPDFLSDPVCFGLELTGDRSWATFVAAGRSGDRIGGEVVAHHPGTEWVLERALQLNAAKPRWFVIDPKSQAGSFIGPFRDAGLPVLECGFTDLARATANTFDAIHNRGVYHLGDPLLDAAVAGATKRPYGDVWLWDRKVGTSIAPLVAFTLAMYGVGVDAPAVELVAFYT